MPRSLLGRLLSEIRRPRPARGPLEAYGTPVIATGLAVAEVIWLRRKGHGFRGPLTRTP